MIGATLPSPSPAGRTRGYLAHDDLLVWRSAPVLNSAGAFRCVVQYNDMSKRNPEYTDTFRASAVLMLQAAGYPDTKGALVRVANHLSIPRQTLQRWCRGERNPPPPEVVTIEKQSIVAILEDIIYGSAGEVKRRIDNEELDAVSLPQLMTVAAIAVDKQRLLLGQSTENSDNVLRIVYTNDWRAPSAAGLPDAPTDD